MNGTPYILHLDTRLAQIPTLVVNTGSHPLRPFTMQQIDITIDNNPAFHPSHVRLEGDDPITLAILLDVGGGQTDLLRSLEKVFPSWVKSSLTSLDRVSIYALDCTTIRAAYDQPSDSSSLPLDLDAAIKSPLTHGKKTRPACGSSIHLRDAIVSILQQLSALPGRRVLLVLDDGYDGGSTWTWDDISSDAEDTAVTIFGLHEPALNSNSGRWLDYATGKSGGIVLTTSSKHIEQTLTDFITYLRDRMILEFPLPVHFPGDHIVHVTIEHRDALALPSGIPIVPIMDTSPQGASALAGGPNTPIATPTPPQTSAPPPPAPNMDQKQR